LFQDGLSVLRESFVFFMDLNWDSQLFLILLLKLKNWKIAILLLRSGQLFRARFQVIFLLGNEFGIKNWNYICIFHLFQMVTTHIWSLKFPYWGGVSICKGRGFEDWRIDWESWKKKILIWRNWSNDMKNLIRCRISFLHIYMHCYHLVRIYMHCCCFVRIYMLCLEKIYSICCRFFAYLMVDLRCYIQPRAISFAVKILKGERNKERTCINQFVKSFIELDNTSLKLQRKVIIEVY
jgi:hypothetical protein